MSPRCTSLLLGTLHSGSKGGVSSSGAVRASARECALRHRLCMLILGKGVRFRSGSLTGETCSLCAFGTQLFGKTFTGSFALLRMTFCIGFASVTCGSGGFFSSLAFGIDLFLTLELELVRGNRHTVRERDADVQNAESRKRCNLSMQLSNILKPSFL